MTAMPQNSPPPLLKMKHVTKIYKSRDVLGKAATKVVALNRFNLEIKKGEIFGLVGESGSGKTTAGRLIVGLEKPTSGKILIENEDVTAARLKKRKIFTKKVQMVFQDPYQSLNPHLSIFDIVVEPLIIHGMKDPGLRVDTVCSALETAGLEPPEDYLDRYPHELSGGQRQRVAIARAMILNPKFMVADEPTSMLDASISFQIFGVLKKLQDDFQVAILFITHSLAAARNLCSRVAVIYRGHLVESGSAEAVIMNPMHPYTKALIDAHPSFGSLSQPDYNTLLDFEKPVPEGEHCPFFPRCRMAQPETCDVRAPLLEKAGPDHQVACFYALPK